MMTIEVVINYKTFLLTEQQLGDLNAILASALVIDRDGKAKPSSFCIEAYQAVRWNKDE